MRLEELKEWLEQAEQNKPISEPPSDVLSLSILETEPLPELYVVTRFCKVIEGNSSSVHSTIINTWLFALSFIPLFSLSLGRQQQIVSLPPAHLSGHRCVTLWKLTQRLFATPQCCQGNRAGKGKRQETGKLKAVA